MTSLFFSYAHRDEDLRNELEIHLAALKRQGIIDAWHDRRIVVGNEVHNEISEHLENADIVLLLVSPYFIASDYCYDVEMISAMQQHDRGEARVIPVILHPCSWQRLPFGKLLATPTDGRPVSKFPNQHDAFLEITESISRAVEELGANRDRFRSEADKNSGDTLQNGSPAEKMQSEEGRARSSNLRIKKQFTDHEKDRFLDETFEYIANYFEESLTELEKRNPEIETRFRRIDSNHFTSAVYVNGTRASGCRIWMGGSRSFVGGIAYSANEDGGDNSFNESLRVADDGYSLFLNPLGVTMRGRTNQEQLTNEGGAEYLWSMLIDPLQR